MTYRALTFDEWHLVVPDFAKNGMRPPDPTVATIFGAFEDGDPKPKGWGVIQLQMVAAPFHCPIEMFKGLMDCAVDGINLLRDRGQFEQPLVLAILPPVGESHPLMAAYRQNRFVPL